MGIKEHGVYHSNIIFYIFFKFPQHAAYCHVAYAEITPDLCHGVCAGQICYLVWVDYSLVCSNVRTDRVSGTDPVSAFLDPVSALELPPFLPYSLLETTRNLNEIMLPAIQCRCVLTMRSWLTRRMPNY